MLAGCYCSKYYLQLASPSQVSGSEVLSSVTYKFVGLF